jgi:hypothetical protein
MKKSRAALVVLSTMSIWMSSSACRKAEGRWRGEGEGIDAGKIREEVRPIWKIDGRQPGQPAFLVPIWVDFGPSGDVFVLDYRQQQITRLTPDGKLVTQFGKRGQEPGGLSKSRRFAIADDKIYVANEGNERIEVLGEANGEVFPAVRSEDVQQPGEIYFVNQKFYVSRRFVPNGSFIHVYDRNWKLEKTIRPADPQEDRLDVLRSLNTVCPAPDGLWIVHPLMNRIQKVSYDGRVLIETSRDLDWKFPKDEKTKKVIPELLVHRACAVDPSGNLYVVYSNPEDWKRGNDVYKFGPDGRLREKAFTLPIFNATMIRFDREGNLYFAEEGSLTKARIERTETSKQ